MRRGHALLTTLVWIALIVTLAFGLAGLTVSHLSTVTYQSNRQQAKALARSVTSTAIARIMADTQFGKAARPSGLLKVREEEGEGCLTFEKDVAREAGIPHSTNNLEESTTAVGAEGKSVPSNAVRLLGVGRVGGVTQRVECILAVPAFPYAIAASGRVEARGGLVIGALPAYPDGAIPDNGTYLPADLLANGTGEQSVFLGEDTSISGDVRAGGEIVLDPLAPPESIRVNGQLKGNSAPEKIPSINVTRYDPEVNGSHFTDLTQLDLGSGQTKLGGICRHQGDMTVEEGLSLDGGTLFVDGNLTIHQGLTGKGILAVDGNISIDGQTQFKATGGVAVLTTKNFSLSGSDPSGSYFQGLVYTEGSFSADKVTLVGSLVAAGEPNDVRLTDLRIMQPKAAPSAAPTPPPQPTAEPGEVRCWIQTHTIDRKEVFLTIEGPRSGPLTLTIKIQGTPAVQSTLSFMPGDYQSFYQTDPRVYDFCTQHGVDRGNVTAALTQLEQLLLAGGNGGGGGPAPTPSGQTGTAINLLDPSNFLTLNERIRIVMWKED